MRIYGNFEVYVGEIKQVTNTVKHFYLFPVHDEQLVPFTGGSHITTFIGKGDHYYERDYSLVSHPTERSHYAISINRDENSRGGSVYWHDHVKVGDTLEISHPVNNFPLHHLAKHHVFYAAGIGITPFLTMMADLELQGKTFELHYTARSEELCAFYDYLNIKYPGKCHFYFTRTDEPNRLTPDIMKSHRIGTHVYFCGPIGMVQQFRDAALDVGYPNNSIHLELFEADDGPKNPFTVELADSNCEVKVGDDETLLEALEREGIDAPYSCRAGGCGQCELSITSGEVDHRDMFYTDDDRKGRKFILTCVSRVKEKSKEKLVLKI